MEYIERTLQVKAALLSRPDLLKKVSDIFVAHLEHRNSIEPIGRGSSRWAYEVGDCEIAPQQNVKVLLKLHTQQTWMKWSRATELSDFSQCCEFGAFETYYDFVSGRVTELKFRTVPGHQRFLAKSVMGSHLPRTFNLSEWQGTCVKEGDLGAVPLFQLAVRYKKWFGALVEGEPPLIEPKATAVCRGTMDDFTVESDRIIDLGVSQSLLIEADRGGIHSFGETYANNLGVRLRGKKYFQKANRLDL